MTAPVALIEFKLRLRERVAKLRGWRVKIK